VRNALYSQDPRSILSMSEHMPTAIVGCLLDVSGSMRRSLESGHIGNEASSQFSAVVRAALKLAKAEQQRDGTAHMFVGAFGVTQQGNNPPVVDLCGVIEALDDERPAHQALIDLANENAVRHVTEYIRAKLTANQARVLHAYLKRHESRIADFVNKIPDEATHERFQNISNAADRGMGAVCLGLCAYLGLISAPITVPLAMYAHSKKEKAKNDAVDNSDALKMARQICDDWLSDFTELKPLRVGKVICLLERLQEQVRVDELRRQDPTSMDTLGGTIRQYIYGSTPMRQALEESLNTFRQKPTITRKVLFIVSDGRSTDGDPAGAAQGLKEEGVTLATVYLTSNNTGTSRQLFDEVCDGWSEGQRTLFNMATKIPATTHPVPVLLSLGWRIPSSGRCAMYASICSGVVLEELCSLLLKARFGSTDVLLDMLGRFHLDSYVNDGQIRTWTNPLDQRQSRTCYAHAIAATVHMALLRIVGREGGYPTIPEIRDRILAEFPPNENGRDSRTVLEAATTWYHPLRFREVDVRGARQAVLKRRPVLTTFRLSESGWQRFHDHFTRDESRTTILRREAMEDFRWGSSDGGHAVVLTGCDPTSLTFLNSWGNQWGNKGSFCIENETVLAFNNFPPRFYDIYWLLSELSDEEEAAYADANDKAFRKFASRYQSILELHAQCPRCDQSAPIADFRGDIREAVCPNCGDDFAPDPSHLLQALYARNGLGK
jgi:hypothetical protein